MNRQDRAARASLPVSRNVITPGLVRGTTLPLSSTTHVSLQGQGIRKGRSNGQHVGMWGTLSQNYKTAATIDRKWDATVSTHGNV